MSIEQQKNHFEDDNLFAWEITWLKNQVVLEIPEINDLKKTAIENHQKQHGKDAIYWFNTSSYSKLEDVAIVLLFAKKNINNPKYTFFNEEEAEKTINNLIQTLQGGNFQEFQKIIYETQNATANTDGKIGENTLKKTQSFLEKNLTYMLVEATVGAEWWDQLAHMEPLKPQEITNKKNILQGIDNNTENLQEKEMIGGWTLLTEDLIQWYHRDTELYPNSKKTYAELYKERYDALKTYWEGKKITFTLPGDDRITSGTISFVGWTFKIVDGPRETSIENVYELWSDYITFWIDGQRYTLFQDQVTNENELLVHIEKTEGDIPSDSMPDNLAVSERPAETGLKTEIENQEKNITDIDALKTNREWKYIDIDITNIPNRNSDENVKWYVHIEDNGTITIKENTVTSTIYPTEFTVDHIVREDEDKKRLEIPNTPNENGVLATVNELPVLWTETEPNELIAEEK